MNTLQAVLAYVVGPTLVAVITYLTTRAAAKGSEHAANRAAVTESESVTVEGYHKLVNDLQEDVKRLREDHGSLRTAHDELAEHVKRLERQAVRDKSMIRHLIAYCRRLIAALRELDPKAVIPEPPAGLDFDDPLTDPTL